jgi:dTDP-4-amino-4,6-dideoxy-D-galactose acyltransferase
MTIEELSADSTIIERCRVLDWDSTFFGLRIARLEGSRLRAAELEALWQWCRNEQIDCLYFLADNSSQETIETAERAAFGFKDLRVTYERKSLAAASPNPIELANAVRVRLHRDSDVEPLVKIARHAHTDSRFFFDRRFDPVKAALLYETWIRKACENEVGCVFVGEFRGRPAGYLAATMLDDHTGQIGLVAVDESFHGKGIGGAMLNESLRWLTERGAARITVVTQGRNVPAQRLYQRAGFLTRDSACWYHRWFS